MGRAMLSTFVVLIAIAIGSVLLIAKQHQIPPPPLADRDLTCAKKPALCTISDERAPDQFTGPGRWKKAAKNPYVGDEKALNFKRWNYVSFTDDKYFVGAALVQFYYIADVFLYIVDRSSKQLYMYSGRLPFGWGVSAAVSSTSGCSKWGTPKASTSDGARPWMELCAKDNVIHFRASVPAVVEDALPSRKVRAEMDVTITGNEDLILAYPLNGNNTRLVYVHKLAGAPVSKDSYIRLDNENHHFHQASGGLDWTKGLLLYRTFWRWVSLNDAHASVSRGDRATKEMLGINLSNDVYDLMSSSGEVFSTENAIWLSGKVYPLTGAIEISVPAEPKKAKWRIRSKKPTEEESLELEFTPYGAREDHANFGIVVSDFIQPFGSFRGTIRLSDPRTGEKIVITVSESSAFGVVENHMAYW